jgi:hypothetical protein
MARKRARMSSSAQTTPAPSHSPSPERKDKKSWFEKRYDTANTSDADVLGGYRTLLKVLIETWLTAGIEKQKRSWTSSAYDHYNTPEIVHDGSSVKYVFVCKRYVFQYGLSCVQALTCHLMYLQPSIH